MSVLVQAVIDRVQLSLQDTTGVRWPVVSELVLWVNDAQRAIVLLKPDAGAVNTTITLEAGTKQSIPSEGNRLLRVVRNMSAATSGTGGRAVRQVERDVLDSMTPDWHDPSITGDAAHSATVKHYTYDDSNPRNFYVYPGVAGASYLEIIYSGNPAVVALVDNIAVPDIWANAILSYVLYMAYQKDSEHAGNRSRASDQYQIFISSVTGKGAVDMATAPTVSPPNPNR